ncbi:TPA: hypothetical protein EYP12_09155, partial [Candidatus Bipolaricaulota bacterium]|nr:hypothetical protein [Candidatus Bipolaricaulota bacterium]
MLTKLRREEGQNLVLIALAMVVLMAFLALVLDLGFAYAQRRRMQNAADAGAFAGAWELAFSETPDPVGRAQEYAVQRNGADSAQVTVDGDRVTVVAIKTL